MNRARVILGVLLSAVSLQFSIAEEGTNAPHLPAVSELFNRIKITEMDPEGHRREDKTKVFGELSFEKALEMDESSTLEMYYEPDETLRTKYHNSGVETLAIKICMQEIVPRENSLEKIEVGKSDSAEKTTDSQATSKEDCKNNAIPVLQSGIRSLFTRSLEKAPKVSYVVAEVMAQDKDGKLIQILGVQTQTRTVTCVRYGFHLYFRDAFTIFGLTELRSPHRYEYFKPGINCFFFDRFRKERKLYSPFAWIGINATVVEFNEKVKEPEILLGFVASPRSLRRAVYFGYGWALNSEVKHKGMLFLGFSAVGVKEVFDKLPGRNEKTK